MCQNWGSCVCQNWGFGNTPHFIFSVLAFTLSTPLCTHAAWFFKYLASIFLNVKNLHMCKVLAFLCLWNLQHHPVGRRHHHPWYLSQLRCFLFSKDLISQKGKERRHRGNHGGGQRARSQRQWLLGRALLRLSSLSCVLTPVWVPCWSWRRVSRGWYSCWVSYAWVEEMVWNMGILDLLVGQVQFYTKSSCLGLGLQNPLPIP